MTTAPFYLLPSICLITAASYVSQRRHILMALLSLEALILSITLLLTLTLPPSNQKDITLLLILLSFAATEASLGLACLVSMIRLKGTDMIKATNSLKL